MPMQIKSVNNYMMGGVLSYAAELMGRLDFEVSNVCVKYNAETDVYSIELEPKDWPPKLVIALPVPGVAARAFPLSAQAVQPHQLAHAANTEYRKGV
jgi:hypothetical protein